jgi:hypothetical protein
MPTMVAMIATNIPIPTTIEYFVVAVAVDRLVVDHNLVLFSTRFVVVVVSMFDRHCAIFYT